MKFVILITDAPTHGSKYHDYEKNMDDYYQEDIS